MTGWIDPLVDDEAPDPLVLAMMTGAGDPAEALARYLERPSWHAEAACSGAGADVFFLPLGGDPGPAKALCAACPVAAECLEAGAEEGHGIWGGLSAKARRKLIRSAA